MVVHKAMESTPQSKETIVRKPVTEQKTFKAKNRIRNLLNTYGMKFHNQNPEILPLTLENRSNKRKRKLQTTSSIGESKSTSSEDNVTTTEDEIPEIDPSDLQELRSVYFKCREVMNKIESKYGHLLCLPEPEDQHRKKKECRNNVSTEECHCSINKKIIFDDDGKQLIIDKSVDEHICPKKLKISPQIEAQNIQIEYNDNEIQLPDDLIELGCILKDSEIETTHRNKVIEKMKFLQWQNTCEIKFNKHSLIEKLKSNPDELLDFKGTNLSTLPGYL